MVLYICRGRDHSLRNGNNANAKIVVVISAVEEITPPVQMNNSAGRAIAGSCV
jgi:hypothetical protein